jgi:hypothetical protein
LQSAGAYTVVGGFWSLAAAVQVEGSPPLHIVKTGTQCVVAWPNPSTGFQLQTSPSLLTPAWSDVDAAAAIVGEEKQVTVPAEPGNRFYRLRKP